jgi:TolA-binding protein
MGLMLVRLVAIGVVIGMAGAAAAQWAVTHWLGVQRQLAPAPVRLVQSDPAPAAKPAPRRAPAASAPVEPEPEVVVEEARADSAPAPTPSASSSQLGLEAESLRAALSALRAGGAAESALQKIDQHLKAFPGGALELEARVARVDALLALGRRQEAKRDLLGLPIENVGRNRELRLIRAELRADDDCRAALSDFQVLVNQALPAAQAERALFGRGACLLRLGDKAAADRDFNTYLDRYPNGRFAKQIRAQRSK